MPAFLTFGVVLLVAVMVSELARRSVVSTAVLFLIAGFVAGPGLLGFVSVEPQDEAVIIIAELALFAVLFTDGMKVGLGDLTSAWRLPGRALLFGLPLVLVITAALAHFLVGLDWGPALLLGAVLSPTDPVFAAAIVGREGVPGRLRHLLNVESGVNDGLALPIVLALVATLGPSETGPLKLGSELAAGIALGVAVPWVAIKLESTRFFSSAPKLQELFPFAIGALLFPLASLTHANLFLAAFAAGVTIASLSPEIKHSFDHFGELLSELLKLGAILVFGALIPPAFLGSVGWSGYLFAVLVLLVARPLAMAIGMIGADITRREWAAAAWFGPKGFASVVYGLLIIKADLPMGDELFHLIALVVSVSIVLHSSTAVPVARQFKDLEAGN